jgi:propionate CoA-transferase
MQVIDAEQAASLVHSGRTVTVSGLVGNLVAEHVLEALERRFLDTGEPRGLTEIHPWLYGGPDTAGLNRFAHAGFIKRIIGSTFILPVLSKTAPINRLVLDDGVEGYCWPANAIFQMLRATGAGRVGFTTTVGLDTFADPRRDGGRLNASAKEDLIELVDIGGQEHLFYPAIPIDVAIIKASTADTEGNLCCEDEGLTQGILLQATAAHNSGGIVIAQVRRVVEAGSMHPLMVEVPGVLVDHVVVHENGRQWEYGSPDADVPASTGARRMPLPAAPRLAQGATKVIGRRALMEVRRGDLVNAGGGLPMTGMFPVVEEEGLGDQFRWSVEHGVFGGRPLSSTHWNPTAITSPGWLLDFYDGGGLSQSFLAFGEIDRHGNVNVGRLGDQLPGPGGFTDIAASTRKVTYCGTMTGGGLQVEATDGTLRIIREGTVTKFVEDCQMVCSSARRALDTGQEIRYVTERAVFRLVESGLELIEVAPGIDVATQVLAVASFPISVSRDLRPMDARLFRDEPMGLVLA